MSTFQAYNPNTGTWYEEDYDHQTESVVIHTKQDVQPVLDYAKRQRNSGVNDKVGDFSKYAIIPATVQVQLLQKGINIHKGRQTKELIKEIETNFPHLKVTNLKHAIK